MAATELHQESASCMSTQLQAQIKNTNSTPFKYSAEQSCSPRCINFLADYIVFFTRAASVFFLLPNVVTITKFEMHSCVCFSLV